MGHGQKEIANRIESSDGYVLYEKSFVDDLNEFAASILDDKRWWRIPVGYRSRVCADDSTQL